jgi:transcription elongation factor GreA
MLFLKTFCKKFFEGGAGEFFYLQKFSPHTKIYGLSQAPLFIRKVSAMTRHPITRQGYERIKNELETLRKVDLPRNVQAISEARAHGDLSENAEFHAAKERQSIIAAKMMEMETILSEAAVVDPLPETDGRVVFGAKVTVYDPESDRESIYQVVGKWESDPDRGRISLNSPLGQALIGREAGDEVRFKTPGGVRILEIVEVLQG